MENVARKINALRKYRKKKANKLGADRKRSERVKNGMFYKNNIIVLLRCPFVSQ